MKYFLNGKQLSTSAVSRAKRELQLPNKYKGGKTRWSREYWVKVVEYIGILFSVERHIIRKAKTLRGCYQYKWGIRMAFK